MSKITILDAQTGEVIERDFTNDEIASQETLANDNAAKQAELEAKALARTSALAKLAALGLTEEEIAAL